MQAFLNNPTLIRTSLHASQQYLSYSNSSSPRRNMSTHNLFCVVLCLFLAVVAGHEKDDPFLYKKFPGGFMWGTATASYQIEGAWNVSGKGVNIWDTFCHLGNRVAYGATGDVACDSYHKYKEDIALMKAMGVSHYRFSISWSRVFSDGTMATYNAPGMQYYKDVLAELKKNNIIPMVTLYHWDLPQPLQDVGGWLNDSIIAHYVDYADRVFSELGGDVPLWLTFNEPFVTCWLGYGINVHAPGVYGPAENGYLCAHNIIRSHARAYHLYDQKYKPSQKGKISITLDSDWKEPKTNSMADKMAADRAMQFKLGWFANPIYKDGDYPRVMKELVANKSHQQGLNYSRLPEFTAAEKAEIRGTYDFFGLNHYTTQLISNKADPNPDPSYDNDQDINVETDPSWPGSASSWLKVVPWGLRKLLNWIRYEYFNPEVYITENGVSDHNGTLQDGHRISFYEAYINNVLKAIDDGCNVKGYTAWSMLDNFEWTQGYTERFGLHYVNFTDPNRPRATKDSAKWYKNLISNNGWDPQTTTTKAVDTTTSNAFALSPSLLVVMVTTMASALSLV